jgi:16S rRNA (uracil1498-N3)-methyltransferase
MNIFYSQNIRGNNGILDEAESHHCVKVLRLQVGDEVFLVDGKGGFFEGVIALANQKASIIEIKKSQFEFGKRNYNIHIAIAPTKNIERFEWFLEKATEIGIDEITPIICHHSERKILREDRLEKVITSAMKQSLKAYHPVFHSLTSFEKFIETSRAGNRLIAHCIESERHDLIKMKPENYDFNLLIGPEGDFSEKEVKIAISKGFLPVSLGKSRLRTETAGIVACQIISDLMVLQ